MANKLIYNPLLRAGLQFVTVETNYPEVATYADLPVASTVTGKIYYVDTTTGSLFTFNKKSAGLYRSNGTTWISADIPSYFSTSEFRVQDSTTPSKQFALDISGVSSSTTRTWSVPDFSDTFVGISGSQALTNKTYNKYTFTTPSTGATITILDGKTFTLNNTLTFAGTDGSTLNIGAGGTLGSNAYTSTAYAPIASPIFTGVATTPQLTIAGSLSSVAWTTTGLGLIISPASYTDSSSSGTVANMYIHNIGAPTLLAGSATTYSIMATVNIESSVDSTNVTTTNRYALRLGGAMLLTGSLNLTGGNVNMSGATRSIGLTDSNILQLTTNNVARITIGTTGLQTHTHAALGSGSTPLSTWTQPVNTGGSAGIWLITGGAVTSQTTATEVTDINFNLSAIMKMVDGTITTQRAFRIQGRTYTPQTSALTITTSSTLEVSAATAGAGTTITNNYAINSLGTLAITTAAAGYALYINENNTVKGGLYVSPGNGIQYGSDTNHSITLYSNGANRYTVTGAGVHTWYRSDGTTAGMSMTAGGVVSINSTITNAQFVVAATNGGGAFRTISDNAGRAFILHAQTNASTNTGYSICFTNQEGATIINTIGSYSNQSLGTQTGLAFDLTSVYFGGIVTPTAILHIAAGTLTKAQFRLTSGVFNTSNTNDGDIAYDGSRINLRVAAAIKKLAFIDDSNVGSFAHNISTPTTGATVTLTNNQYNIINPAGALLALTVNLPSSPANNDTVIIKYTQNITTVTYGNGTVADGITAPSAGGLVVLVYDSGTTTWY